MSMFMKEQQALLLERDDKAKQEAKVERAEQKREMEAKMAEQKQEMEAKLSEMAPQEAVSGQQIEALTARLEAVHAAKMLSDDELFAVEDCIADFIDVKASCGVVTMEVANTHRAVGKVQKLVVLSEGLTSDAMFARQVRRRFV